MHKDYFSLSLYYSYFHRRIRVYSLFHCLNLLLAYIKIANIFVLWYWTVELDKYSYNYFMFQKIVTFRRRILAYFVPNKVAYISTKKWEKIYACNIRMYVRNLCIPTFVLCARIFTIFQFNTLIKYLFFSLIIYTKYVSTF